MSSLCYAGTLHELSIESSRASLKTCAPKEGICFAAVNKAKGVLQLGCWPSQAFESGLAWWGNPMCKKDARSLKHILRQIKKNIQLHDFPHLSDLHS